MDSLILEADFHADASRLSIHYKVTNHGVHTAYLLNRVFRQVKPGETKIHKDFAYVYIDPPNVVVEKAIPAIPEGLAPNEPVAPLSTPLRPGASFEETVELALPLVDSRPYLRPTSSHLPVPVSSVHFVLGYMLGSDGTTERSEMVFGEPVVLFTYAPGKRGLAGRFDVERTIISLETGEKTSIPVLPPGPKG